MPRLPWSDLTASGADRGLAGLRLAGMPPDVAVYIAVEPDGRRHLLIHLPRGDELTDESTRGVRITTREWTVGDREAARYIDLVCLDQSLHDTFDAVVQQIAENVAAMPGDARAGVVEALRRWRRFWAVETAGLPRDAALGLFGELWFLGRWMRPLTAAKFAAWFGPDVARHDFQAAPISVEVKTTAAGQTTIHHVQSLDQLADPETGDLYLFSLHVSDDALASNSLPVLVDALLVEAHALGAPVAAKFEDRLAQVGYSPAHAAAYARPLRVKAEALFRVSADFPRLTRGSYPGGLPAAIPDVSYWLLADALTPWRVASRPAEAINLFEGW